MNFSVMYPRHLASQDIAHWTLLRRHKTTFVRRSGEELRTNGIGDSSLDLNVRHFHEKLQAKHGVKHGCESSIFCYVEKKTCEFAVEAGPANFLGRIGAVLAEIGFTFESFKSSFSILRCSCGWGRLISVMDKLSHVEAQKINPSSCTNLEAPTVKILKHSDNAGR
jgi:hypothetical protein